MFHNVIVMNIYVRNISILLIVVNFEKNFSVISFRMLRLFFYTCERLTTPNYIYLTKCFQISSSNWINLHFTWSVIALIRIEILS
jgi:hypothetical protein